jgi:hypothetical protein
MRVKSMLPVLVALVLGGCVIPNPVHPGADPDLVHTRLLVAYDALGHPVPPTDVWPGPLTISYVPVGKPAGEPTIGVTNEGALFYQAYAEGNAPAQQLSGPAIMRSMDRGATWKDVSFAPLTSPTTSDPFLWVDRDTGRVFTAHLYVLTCSYLSYSDNQGATWVTNPVACGRPVNDHPSIATGPPRPPLVANPAYRNLVYYAYNSVLDGSKVSVSLDGGQTWPLNSQATPGTSCYSGLHGKVRVDRAGRVFLPKRDCDGWILAASEDNGMTWRQTRVGKDVGSPPNASKDPDIAIDEAGTLYAVWVGRDHRVYTSDSADAGRTWTASHALSPPQITTATMPSIVVGSAGRLAVSYLGVKGGNGAIPKCVGSDAHWHLFTTWSLDALADNPRSLTYQVTNESNPVEIGGIDTGPSPDKCVYHRNLLDFIDSVADKEGRLFVGSVDGCVDCSSAEQSVGRAGIVSALLEGPSLVTGMPLSGGP